MSSRELLRVRRRYRVPQRRDVVRRCAGILLWDVPDVTAVPAAKVVEVREPRECFQQNGVRRVARRALLSDHRLRAFRQFLAQGLAIPAKKLASPQFSLHNPSQLFTSFSNRRRIGGGIVMGRRSRFADLQPCATCSRCRGHGWLCEQHPRCYWPHNDCVGPGIPCDAPGCLADWLARRAKRESRKTSTRHRFS
jgi:hypothetical protein